MRSRSSEWFEVKVRYDKMNDEGMQKPITEQYVVDAFSFTETESIITEEMSAYIVGEFNIKDIKPAAYKEIFFSDMPADDRWFKAKLFFITLDEKKGKEKRTAVNYLVQAHSLPQAVTYINDVMGKTMVDYVIASVAETQILDVFEHDGKALAEQKDDKPEYEEQ